MDCNTKDNIYLSWAFGFWFRFVRHFLPVPSFDTPDIAFRIHEWSIRNKLSHKKRSVTVVLKLRFHFREINIFFPIFPVFGRGVTNGFSRWDSIRCENRSPFTIQGINKIKIDYIQLIEAQKLTNKILTQWKFSIHHF